MVCNLRAGHAIGVIVADTEAAAQAASRAVSITYQDILPILSIEQAMEASSYFEVLHASNVFLASSEPSRAIETCAVIQVSMRSDMHGGLPSHIGTQLIVVASM